MDEKERERNRAALTSASRPMRLLLGLQSRSPSCTTPALAWFGVSLEMLLAAYIAILSPNIAIYIHCALNLRIRSQMPLQSTVRTRRRPCPHRCRTLPRS